MSGAGVDPGERARILLLRGDELLAAATPESLDEAMLAYQGGLEVAREPGVADTELPRLFEDRIAAVRRRLEPGTDQEDEAGEADAEPAEGAENASGGEPAERAEPGGAAPTGAPEDADRHDSAAEPESG